MKKIQHQSISNEGLFELEEVREFYGGWDALMDIIKDRFDKEPNFGQTIVTDTNDGFTCIIQQVC